MDIKQKGFNVMSTKDSIIVDEDGEVIEENSLVPVGDGSSLKELIPYNRMSNIAKSTLTRLNWNKKTGVWSSSLGEFSSLEIVPVAASELYAVRSEQGGKFIYYGVDENEAEQLGIPTKGRRVAFMEKENGASYSDFFGMTVPFADALCKIGTTYKGEPILIKGSDPVPTSNGVIHIPKIVR
jgi:hypothetical protein